MAASNMTSSHVSEFVLICFPGIQSWQHWLSIPLALLFLVTLTANITLIATIYSAQSLHQPMYYFLCLLALVDLLISISVSPKALVILWFDEKTISPAACFTQLFIIYFTMLMQTCVFLFLAHDRYIAICDPLHYSCIITSRWTAQAAALSLIWSTAFSLPYPLLTARLHYCGENTIAHCFCENLPLAKLACDISAGNTIYPLVLLCIFLIFPSLLMGFSYTMIIRAVLRLGSLGAALKAFSTCSSHLILIGFIYCTAVITAISNRAERSIPRYVHVLIAVLQLLTPPALHPLVYGIRTHEIRHGLRKLLRRIWHVLHVYINSDSRGAAAITNEH